jgi:phage-related minor tail protein
MQMEAKLKELHSDLEKVKKQIAKYEKRDEEKGLTDAEQNTLNYYLQEKKSLNEEIKTLESSLEMCSVI